MMLRQVFPKIMKMVIGAETQTYFRISKRQTYIKSCAYSVCINFDLYSGNGGIPGKSTASATHATTKLDTLVHRNLSSTSSSNQDEDDIPLAKGDKLMHTKLKSTRIDAVLKAGLQMSRNKIEKAFYEDRIRLNGARPKKKSQTMSQGDEVDLVKCQNRVNPLFIDVSRVELLEIDNDGNDSDDSESDDDDSKIPAKLKRYKTLTIENYDGAPWKGSDLE